MHRLSSPHTVRFHTWYETRNNLWLILEYCTGGNLLALLKQDGQLPEPAVKVSQPVSLQQGWGCVCDRGGRACQSSEHLSSCLSMPTSPRSS